MLPTRSMLAGYRDVIRISVLLSAPRSDVKTEDGGEPKKRPGKGSGE